MADYFHSALRGEQIHEAKIKVLPEGSIFPVPDWEGQFLVIGSKLYVSVTQNNILTWMQPKAYNSPQLPPNVVTFERAFGIPENRFNYESGVIYTNIQNNEIYYLNSGEWLKLGAESSANKLLIQKTYNSSYIAPPGDLMNAALLQTWEPNKSYYFKFEAPDSTLLNQYATSNYFIHLTSGGNIAENVTDGALLTLNTTGLEVVDNTHQIMIYFVKEEYKFYLENVFCNFFLDLESRLIKVDSIAVEYQG